MAPERRGLAVLRIVVREGFSRDMADNLVAHHHEAVEHLSATPPPAPKKVPHDPKTHHVC